MKDKQVGVLISFEGIDASGKNTQSRMLFDYFKRSGTPVSTSVSRITATPIGQEIRNFLDQKRDYDLESRHLLYAANRYEHKERIETWISEGDSRCNQQIFGIKSGLRGGKRSPARVAQTSGKPNAKVGLRLLPQAISRSLSRKKEEQRQVRNRPRLPEESRERLWSTRRTGSLVPIPLTNQRI